MTKKSNAVLGIYPHLIKKNKKTGRIPIYIKITYCGQKVEYRAPKELDLYPNEFENWDYVSRRIRTKNRANVNTYLNIIESNWDKYMMTNNFYPKNSISDILTIITNRHESQNCINVTEFIDDFLIRKVDNDATKSEGTKRNYKKAIKHFKAFLKREKIEHLNLADFKYLHADNFNLYMTDSNGARNSPVSASTNVRKIKTVFKEAMKQEILTKNPFEGIKIVLKSTNKTSCLTVNQLKSIINCPLITQNDNLAFYRDIFLFLAYTGMSYIDFYRLDTKSIFPIFKNRLKIDTTRKKSGKSTLMIVPIPAQVIIEKYLGSDPDSEFVFPRITGETINLKLKLIGAFAKINIKLSSKIARTTCNQLINNTGNWDNIYKRFYMGWSNNSDISNVYTTIDDNVMLNNTIKLESYLSKNLEFQ